MIKIILLVFFFVLNVRSETKPAFTYGTAEPIITLNPFAEAGLATWQANQLIFDFLLIEKPGDRDVFLPGLAKSWQISDDKRQYIFELRDAQWSDGTPVTAEDVKFSFDHIFDDQYKSPWRASFEGIEKVDILSSKKIRFTAKKSNFEAWKNISIALRILPKHFYQKPTSPVYGKQALGSGPYKINEFDAGKKLILEKNPLWWGWKDSILNSWFSFERIEFRTIAESSAPSYMQKNEIDLAPISSTQIFKNLSNLDSSSAYRLINDPNKNTQLVEQILLNLKDPLFVNKNVRQALNLLIDRKNLCSKIYGTKIMLQNYNPTKGLALLKKLGWKDEDHDGILELKKDGQIIHFKFNVNYSSPDYAIILDSLQQSLKTYGIAMNVSNTENNIFWKLLRQKDFSAYIDRLDKNQIALSSVWSSDGPYNNTSFSSKTVDQLLSETDRTFDQKNRQRLNQKIQKAISLEVPSLILCEIQHADFIVNARHSIKSVEKGIPVWGWFKK